jgi:hypothetical protein
VAIFAWSSIMIDLSPASCDLIGECLVHEVWMLEETISSLQYFKQEQPESFNEFRELELQNSITNMARIEQLLLIVSPTWNESLAAWRLFIDNVEIAPIPDPELGDDVW